MSTPENPYQSSDSTPEAPGFEKPSLLRRIVKWILYLVGFFILVFALLAFWFLNEQRNYATTAVPYIEALIPEIATWDPDVVWGHYDQDVRSAISMDDHEKIVRFMSKLGDLKSIGKPDFRQVSKTASTRSGSKKLVTYSVPAVFENDDATIDLILVDRDGEFSVHYFKINSLAFIDDVGVTEKRE